MIYMIDFFEFQEINGFCSPNFQEINGFYSTRQITNLKVEN